MTVMAFVEYLPGATLEVDVTPATRRAYPAGGWRRFRPRWPMGFGAGAFELEQQVWSRWLVAAVPEMGGISFEINRVRVRVPLEVEADVADIVLRAQAASYGAALEVHDGG